MLQYYGNGEISDRPNADCVVAWLVTCQLPIFLCIMKGENKMTLTEILSLAKAGYKKKDIDALINAENTSTEQTDASSVDNTISLAPTEETSVDIPVSTEEPSVDYKSLYEATMKTLETTQTALRDAQKINSTAPVNMGEKPQNTTSILEDVARSFM